MLFRSSDWLADKQHYQLTQYAADMTTLLARLTADGASDIRWMGTSMGGMIGMILASLEYTPITRLVLNDIGIIIPRIALERIAKYVGVLPTFKTLRELNLYVRMISAPFGPLSDEQWDHLTRHNARQNEQGDWLLNYDPGIALPFQQGPLNEVDLSGYYDRITCPTLLLRGADSDLLLKDIAQNMTQRGPRARLVEFAGVGHAPMLMAPDQVEVVSSFLSS